MNLMKDKFDDEFMQQVAKTTTIREPCKRCTYNEAKLHGSRKRRRFRLEEMKGAPDETDIIGYTCDVGIKSLLRSICEFFQLRLRGFLSAYTGDTMMEGEVIEAFLSSDVLEEALEAE